MPSWLELTIVVLLVLGIVQAVRIAMMRAKGYRPLSNTNDEPVDDIALLQEIHRGLERMERRIEALETLLNDQEEARKTPSGGRRP